MILGVCLVLAAYLTYRLFLRDHRKKHLPPLVPGPPIINHTFIHLEQEFPWRITKWTQKYGDVFRTKSAATDFIWLGSPQAVKDLIDRRSAIYSSRQPQPMALGAASGGKRMTFMPKGKQWRTLRAIIHRVFIPFTSLLTKLLTPQMAAKYAPIQSFEAKQLSVNLLDDPDNFYMHNRRYATSVILQFVYGRRVPVCTLPP
jgi:cytochrome P450